MKAALLAGTARRPPLSGMPLHEQELEILRHMRPDEKLRVMHALIRQAFELKAAVIRAREPSLPESEIRTRAWKLVGGERP